MYEEGGSVENQLTQICLEGWLYVLEHSDLNRFANSFWANRFVLLKKSAIQFGHCIHLISWSISGTPVSAHYLI